MMCISVCAHTNALASAVFSEFSPFSMWLTSARPGLFLFIMQQDFVLSTIFVINAYPEWNCHERLWPINIFIWITQNTKWYQVKAAINKGTLFGVLCETSHCAHPRWQTFNRVIRDFLLHFTNTSVVISQAFFVLYPHHLLYLLCFVTTEFG